jgi:hypothetical protein
MVAPVHSVSIPATRVAHAATPAVAQPVVLQPVVVLDAAHVIAPGRSDENYLTSIFASSPFR